MGSPVSPIVCNLYLEDLEQRAISTALNPPAWWFRYVDDTHSKHKKALLEEFTDHLNTIDPDIQWTCEVPKTVGSDDNALAFLDSLSCVKADGSLKLKIYRKATHTDQYLNFASNHPIEHKLSVIRSLYHRATSVVTEPEDQKVELDYIDSALRKCDYPNWILKKSRAKLPVNQAPPPPAPPTAPNQKATATVTLPYISGLSEKLKGIFKTHNIRVIHKPQNKLRNILVSPKDKAKKEDTTDPIYFIPCSGGDSACGDTYVGETERSLWTRFLEHKRPSGVGKSEVADHLHVESSGHTIDFKQIKVLDRDSRWFERGIREAIYIRAYKPTLNRNAGRYTLPTVWNRLIDSNIGHPSVKSNIHTEEAS